jgi:hypothetical protein
MASKIGLKKDDDGGLPADLGDAVASRLAALKPGQSMDIIQRTDPPVTSKVAREIAPKPEQFFDLGVGAGRAPPGIPLYVTKLEREPQAVPGYQLTAPGLAAMTSRADSLAVESDYRVGGNDERGTMSFGPETKSTPKSPERLQNPDASRDSGGPIAIDGRRVPAKRPASHRHVGEEEGAP